MTNNWLVQSLIAVAFLTPAWLAMPFFAKNYGVSASVFAVWYFIGVAISIAMFGVSSRESLVPSLPLVATLLVFGFVVGGVANCALFTAVVGAPNPGLPVAISNVASITTFLCAIALAKFFPSHFAPATANLKSLIGIMLVTVGVALVSIR